jgi:hypothetical protein
MIFIVRDQLYEELIYSKSLEKKMKMNYKRLIYFEINYINKVKLQQVCYSVLMYDNIVGHNQTTIIISI